MRQIKIGKLLYYFVLISFIIPVVYLIFRILITSNTSITDNPSRTRADYILMLVQCVLGVIVIHIPSLLSRKWKIKIPTALFIMYIVFLYCAIFLGEVRNFYHVVPHWDDILHCFSSIMTGSFGFMVILILNDDKHVAIELSPKFAAVFAFSFSLTIGALWEIYEFAFDGLLGLNMQKFMLEDGTVLSGHAAISDTMKDLVVDCFGALIAACIGYVSMKMKKGWTHEYLSNKTKEYDTNG